MFSCSIFSAASAPSAGTSVGDYREALSLVLETCVPMNQNIQLILCIKTISQEESSLFFQ